MRLPYTMFTQAVEGVESMVVKHNNPLRALYSKFAKKQEATYLRKYGLYYEDALQDWVNPTMDLAITLLPIDVQQDRLRRIQRANYLRHNHEYLDEPLREYDPHNSYGLIDTYLQLKFKKDSDNSYL